LLTVGHDDDDALGVEVLDRVDRLLPWLESSILPELSSTIS
jgi:hypothetical protein